MGNGIVATPTLTADVVVFQKRSDGLYLLLIQRKKEPHKGLWALPGGKLDEGETLELCAVRELEEETGVHVRLDMLCRVGVYSAIGRDPRGHYISSCYAVIVRDGVQAMAGDDASNVAWFPVANLPALAFDHDKMITDALR